MAEETYGELMEHEFDGIREYDNPCPTWWHLILWGTVVFSVVYFIFYHIGPVGKSVAQSYDDAMAENLKLRFAEIGELKLDEPTLLEYMGKPDWLVIGSNVFQTNCKSCHGAEGTGLVGPNLTDDNYKNVKKLVDIGDVVTLGASAGAMPAWGNRLHPNEIVLVAAYVATLRGQNKPGPGDAVEARDGHYKPIPPWPSPETVQEDQKEDAAAAPESTEQKD